MKLQDLYTLDEHEDGRDCLINDDEGNPTTLKIKLKGTDSSTYRLQLKKQKNAFMEAKQKGKDFDEDKHVIDALVECTVGWSGTDEKYTKKLCRELYTKAPFVREQVDLFIARRENFIKAKRKK